ncbi:hypothetical protein Snoj_55280 [Streptomyces nojiriensis]|uniref:Uncharacterized protein n=1 Tax=Streptomyces nojiriensis TaxID=66374 RepID=A0ABQ3SUZ5_9ACTN|nr:hypothetical protein GCM10010205_23530 [Streptomyces nojiriensis]GHI71610.1 hypothetical protein Snoj_55280 [Streptomyces nojiriensis]
MWVALVGVGVLGVGGAVLASDDEDGLDGWVREPAGAEVAARVGGDPSRGTVAAELAAAATAAGLTPGAPHPAEQGELADCIADWRGDGPADDGRLAALETALEERGWQVTARRGEPVGAVALKSGSWRLEFTNGGLVDTLSLVATRSGRTCEEAFRRAEATRGPRG